MLSRDHLQREGAKTEGSNNHRCTQCLQICSSPSISCHPYPQRKYLEHNTPTLSGKRIEHSSLCTPCLAFPVFSLPQYSLLTPFSLTATTQLYILTMLRLLCIMTAMMSCVSGQSSGTPATPLPRGSCQRHYDRNFTERLSGPECWDFRCGVGNEVFLNITSFDGERLCATETWVTSRTTCLQAGEQVTMDVEATLSVEGSRQGYLSLVFECRDLRTLVLSPLPEPLSEGGLDGLVALSVVMGVVSFLCIVGIGLTAWCCIRRPCRRVIIPNGPIVANEPASQRSADDVPPEVHVFCPPDSSNMKTLPNGEIPPALLCGISSQLMVYPVKCVCTPYPHTFDRAAIVAHLKRYPYCPTSGLPLGVNDLTRNAHIEAALQKFNSTHSERRR